MNENADNKQIEKLLKKAHLPELSPKLKERITNEAKKTMIETSSELPWLFPIRRLIVSAAAAVFIIWLTNSFSDYTLARWLSSGPRVENKQMLDLESIPELSYSPLARYLAPASRKPSITNASMLQNYPETLRRVLNESQQNGSSITLPPTEGRSILLRKQSVYKSYS